MFGNGVLQDHDLFDIPEDGDMDIMPDMTDVEMLTTVLRSVFGNAVWDDSAEDTARRVLKYWSELTPNEDIDFNFTTFAAECGMMVVIDNIEFASSCAHHLLPFHGRVHVAYIPNKLQVGLSKIPRLVKHWAQRPQVQERLTNQIARDLKKRLDPMGVMVVIESQHTCATCRGARNHNGWMRTSLPLGVFLSNPAARDEFFNLIHRRV